MLSFSLSPYQNRFESPTKDKFEPRIEQNNRISYALKAE